ncbi:carotenoid oxygenase family protein [Streptosporangium sp. NPDC000396]|uniref:carotenoid oxygenase family protein n=1 Tax=Streptosporangium sp. NPDC000396 TaxID=3366185 RepID=UPI0036885B2F
MTVTGHVNPIATPRHLPHNEPLPVDGVLPHDLDGALVQVSPHPGRSGQSHTTVGPALLSGVRLGGGIARWHRTTAKETGGHPPAWAIGSAPWTRTTGAADPSPDGPCRVSVAPPVKDRSTSEWHTVATYPGLDWAEHLIMGPDGGIREARPFGLGGAPLMHAVALTERFVVVFDLPVTYRRAAAMVGTGFPYRWQQDRPARIGLLPRQPGGEEEPRWFPVAPCYVSHSVNAYEEGDRVIVDAVRHDRAFDTPSWTEAGAAGSSRVHRWTLDLDSGAAYERPLADSLALASVDPRRAGRGHELMFGCSPDGNALIGHDLAAATVQVRKLDPGWQADQPVFVPRGRAEGDGWIVALTRNAAQRRSELLVLDALHLTGRPQAVVHLPIIPPTARHTMWMARSSASATGSPSISSPSPTCRWSCRTRRSPSDPSWS